MDLKDSFARAQQARWPLIFLIAVEVAILFFLLFSFRMPGGFDGFQYFHTQYYFLNNVVQTGEIPQWIPYLTHGTVSTWWYAIQAGLWQNVLLALGWLARPFLQASNFLGLFQMGMLVDQMILLLGTWLLAKRYYASSVTTFVVATAMLGTCVWASQPWYNFHFYYALPLILYFTHVFFDTGKWRYAGLAGNLLALQSLGNLPYFIPVTGLVVTLYFILLFFSFPRPSHPFRLGWNAFGAILGIAAGFLLAYGAVSLNTSEIINYNYGRTLESATTLPDFLNYGRNFSALKWIELLLGVSPFLDMTLFCGFLTIVLIVIGLLCHRQRQSWALWGTIIVLLLISMATVVAQAAYHGWPGMKYYRHLSLLSPVIKCLLCFLAGYGWEALSDQRAWTRPVQCYAVAGAGLTLVGVAIFLGVMGQDLSLAKRVFSGIVEGGTYVVNELQQRRDFVSGLPDYLDPALLSSQLNLGAGAAGLLAVGLLGLVLSKSEVVRYRWLVGLLMVHVMNVYGYKVMQLVEKSVVVPADMRSITRFQPMTFWERRSPVFLSEGRDAIMTILKFNPVYWSTNMFLFKDEIGHSLRTDHWLRPLDKLVRALQGQSLTDLTVVPRGLSIYNFWEFPREKVAGVTMAGLSESKVQFFGQAPALADSSQAELLREGVFSGEQLLLDHSAGGATGGPLATFLDPTVSERVRLPWSLRRFDANQVVFEVHNDSGAPAWLLYSDVWHAGWSATVNGQPVPVSRAQLAYKAVPLVPGKNEVYFIFAVTSFTGLTMLVGWWSVGWFVFLTMLLKKTLQLKTI